MLELKVVISESSSSFPGAEVEVELVSLVCCVLQRLVVCLEESVYIHNIKDMKLIKTLLSTPSNPAGTETGRDRLKPLVMMIWY